MTGSLKYTPGILYFSSQLKFLEDDFYYSPGIADIIRKMTGFRKYKPGILYFSSRLKFPKEDVSEAPGIGDIIL